MSVTLSDRCYRSLSFSGCGFLCIYHAGVCAAIKEYAPEMLSGSMSGASAGSIIAACLICNVCISRGASIILRIVNETAKNNSLSDPILSPNILNFRALSADGLRSSGEGGWQMGEGK
ncbi:unnamed protein product [Anisakis simplex]|uniref:PNPLA domain-containing protein n=1 Tax=Anisakis simplex TaxID=6269 RepID=A0A0M3KID3_ANISI|nr:unnamed protein product [Anisakis simplex]